MQWILRARGDLTRELLERSDLGVEQIADRIGLGTGANLRLHFHRILGTSPERLPAHVRATGRVRPPLRA